MWITANTHIQVAPQDKCTNVEKCANLTEKCAKSEKGRKEKSATDAPVGPILVCQWVTRRPKIHK